MTSQWEIIASVCSSIDLSLNLKNLIGSNFIEVEQGLICLVLMLRTILIFYWEKRSKLEIQDSTFIFAYQPRRLEAVSLLNVTYLKYNKFLFFFLLLEEWSHVHCNNLRWLLQMCHTFIDITQSIKIRWDRDPDLPCILNPQIIFWSHQFNKTARPIFCS
jgi:hypothetical protein